MKLLIISPQHQESYHIEWLAAHTPQGDIVIKPGHAPLIVTLVEQSEFSFLLTNGETISFHLVRPGLLEIDRQGAVALISQKPENS